VTVTIYRRASINAYRRVSCLLADIRVDLSEIVLGIFEFRQNQCHESDSLVSALSTVAVRSECKSVQQHMILSTVCVFSENRLTEGRIGLPGVYKIAFALVLWKYDILTVKNASIKLVHYVTEYTSLPRRKKALPNAIFSSQGNICSHKECHKAQIAGICVTCGRLYTDNCTNHSDRQARNFIN